MCRIRSIRETAKYFKEMDPDTEVTEHTLRKMIAEGTIPAVKTGIKYLVNLDLVLERFGAQNDSDKFGADPMRELVIEK